MPKQKFSELKPDDRFVVNGTEYQKTEPRYSRRGRLLSNAVNTESPQFARFGDAASVDAYAPTRRQMRYGNLVRGWGWRTEPALLEQAEAVRLRLNLSRTEFIETALRDAIKTHSVTA